MSASASCRRDGVAVATLAMAGSLLLNAVLFLALPLLTQDTAQPVLEPLEQGIFLAAHTPPPPPRKPPEPEPEKEKEPPPTPKVARVAPKQARTPVKRMQPMDAFDFEPATGLLAGVAVPPPAPALARSDFELAEVDTPPRRLHGPPPRYPYGAKRRRLEGKVVVRALVMPNGRATRISVVESQPAGIFEEAVLNALSRWRFEPGVLDGQPVATWVVIPFEFNLS